MTSGSFGEIVDALARRGVRYLIDEYRRALVKPLGSLEVRFVCIPALIAMKRLAGRPQDKIDIEYLRKIADDPR